MQRNPRYNSQHMNQMLPPIAAGGAEVYVWHLIHFSYGIGLFSLWLAKYRLPKLLQYGKTRQKKLVGVIEPWYTSIAVPRRYFSHFYVLSFVLATANLYWFPEDVITSCIFFHSLRRLVESARVTKWGSESRMHAAHYLVGLWFYSVLNLSVYLQLNSRQRTRSPSTVNKVFGAVGAVGFLLASWDQARNHIHLAHMIKYTLPRRGLFKIVACAHYFDEIVIYASLAAMEATTRWSLTVAVIWVCANLGVSAVETKRYYDAKFKGQAVAPYALIPYIM
ncbi:ADL073Wp [Eremothecium gossypii ATCC 10895]|uniref:Polyprenal reductase n=1 Tax=Eremothecium gossypii (strain ATCC 10895 / CBS 109.51 / FGSC 9923 / NRRL Y-1056) TaxID=284811 RepID=Q75AK0_EREGS|nr:ADL073Wp [Eremothecium gossypii ATCC 10895]AAS51847.1 ADL073Wp [Eremothecium gossypii ATCC 10895]AEY96144.1 FADL073Wp [Eremothecium gossypii FDAG1]